MGPPSNIDLLARSPESPGGGPAAPPERRSPAGPVSERAPSSRPADLALRRIEALQRLTAALSEAVTLHQVADTIVGEGVVALDAASGALHLFTGDRSSLELFGHRGLPAEFAASSARLPGDTPRPVGVVARTREPLWISAPEELEARFPETTTAISADALAAIPLVTSGRVDGALVLGFAVPRAFPEDERVFTLTLVRHCCQALDRARLYEAERRSNMRLTLLAEASAILSSQLEPAVAMDRIAQLLVPALAHVCWIDIVDEQGALRELTVAHRDPRVEDRLRGIRRRRTPDGARDHPLYGHGRGARARVVRERDEALLGAPADEDTDRAAIRELSPATVLVAPMDAGGRMVGVMRVGWYGQEFPPEDLAFCEEFARRIAASLDNARALRAERAARIDAERVASRLARLQEITSLLSRALTPSQVAEVTAAQGAAAIDGSSSAVVLAPSADGVELEVIGHHGVADDVAAAMPRVLIDARDPIAAAYREHETQVLETHEAYLAEYPDAAGALAPITGAPALACIPLLLEGEAVGVLAVTFRQERRLSDAERLFMLTVARQCAQALDRARLYQKAQEANLAWEQANRAKDEFLGTVSHELRTPLNAVLGWSQLLRRDKDRNPEFLAKGLSVIDRNARAQTKLIEDLLDVSRIISGKLKLELHALDLEAVVRACIEVIRPTADARGVEVWASIERGGAVSGDPDRLQQVVWNLLSNSVKFTPRGGHVEIRLECHDGHAHVIIADSGRGIEASFLPYVFDRFRQADGSPTRRHGGLGLGLAIVRHLVELHGGTVQAESPGLGKGSTFTVKLPLREAAIFDRGRVSRETDPGPLIQRLDGLKLLVVDDEPDARELLATLLGSSGAEVAVASSAAEAFRLLVGFSPDVVISDIGMPGEDGYSFLRKLRSSGTALARVPALALTAFAGPEDARRAVLAGFHTHLPKPAEPETLIAVVASLGGRIGG